MQTIKLGLVQMYCEKGKLDENLAATYAYLQEGVSQGVDILCFPEMSITGYANPEKHPQAVLDIDGPEVARFVDMTKGTQVTAIAGIIERNADGKPFITQIVAREGTTLGVYRKRTIAEDEVDWFAPGSAVAVFQHAKTSFGISICADIDTPELFAEQARLGAQIIFEAAAAGLYGAQETRNWLSGYHWWQSTCKEKLGRYAQDNSIFIAVATQAGRTIDEDFPGGGYVFAPDGTCLASTSDWSEGMLFVELAPG